MRRPRHQARQGRDHARHPERRRGGPQGPRRVGHRPHRRRGEARRHPRRQDHAQGRDPALPRGEAAPRHLRREGRRRARQLAQVPPGVGGIVINARVFSRKGTEKDERAARHRGPRSAPASSARATRRSRSSATRSSAASRELCSARPRRGKLVDDKGKVLLQKGADHRRGRARRDPAQVLGRDPGRRRRGASQRSLRDLEEHRARPRGALPRQDRAPLQGRRAAAGRHQDGEGLHRHQAQAPGRRQDGRPPRQQGRHQPHPARRGHAVPRRTARRSTSCSTRSACRAA